MERENQTAEELRQVSEYIKTVESFGKYAYKEWVDGNDQRALILSCVDRTLQDGTGMVNIVTGDKSLLTAAFLQMLKDKDLAKIFHDAHMVNEIYDNLSEEMRRLNKQLRTLYTLAAVDVFWTIGVIGFQMSGIGNWITTITSLLITLVAGFILGREIQVGRRMLKRMKNITRKEE
jgi:hypothetical protein